MTYEVQAKTTPKQVAVVCTQLSAALAVMSRGIKFRLSSQHAVPSEVSREVRKIPEFCVKIFKFLTIHN